MLFLLRKPLHISSILMCQDLEAFCRAFHTNRRRDPSVPPFCWVSTNRTGLSPQKFGYWSRWGCNNSITHTHSCRQSWYNRYTCLNPNENETNYADNGSVTWVEVAPTRQRKSCKSDRNIGAKANQLQLSLLRSLGFSNNNKYFEEEMYFSVLFKMCVRPSGHRKKEKDVLSKLYQ